MNKKCKRNPSRHRDVYRSFYTTNSQLVAYMIRLLAPEHGDSCLEPAAGSGCFIDGMLATGKQLKICAMELSADAISILQTKYADYSNIQILHQDFLLSSSLSCHKARTFDRIIANPPYGGWQTYKKRNALKTIFPGLYVKETYSLFLVQSLYQLRFNGRAVFILPETFLYLHLQKELRKRVLDQYSILSIDIFPSKLFPHIHFGYAGLCIISIGNQKPACHHSIYIRQCQSLTELISDQGMKYQVNQHSILLRPECTFPLQGYSAETRLIDHATLRLGDIADCVTGIYTGADTQFLRRSHNNLTRGRKKYQEADTQHISQQNNCPPLDGLPASACFIPLLKGGGIPYFKPVVWFIDWSEQAVLFYKTNPKARFQNRQYYFQRGIGFSMVSSGRATASLIQKTWLFDQSVVGVFPKDPALFGFIMALLNSTICWKLLRQINPSANHSARYLRRLPIILPNPERLAWLDDAVSNYLRQLELTGQRNEPIESILDETIGKLYDGVGA